MTNKTFRESLHIACAVIALGAPLAAAAQTQTLTGGSRQATTKPAEPSPFDLNQPAGQPASRSLPSPFESPPFPYSDFLGPTIGTPDTTPDWFLQKALNTTPVGKFLQDNRNRTYGWISPSFNWSTSKHSNLPAAYPLAPNKVVLDQFVLVTERALDTVQKDHVDWGYHVLALTGIDYRYMIAKGFFSDQLLKRNELYGWDIPEFDLRWYFPQVADGMTLKIGRFISTPDIEACPTPVNYIFSHSVMFSIDPYTFFGALADIRLNKSWTIELGVVGTNDVAPWDPSTTPNGHLMFKWVSDSNNDSVWAGINSLGDGKWRANHDDLQHIVGTWTHRFSDKVHMCTEAYYMWQYNAFRGGTVNYGPIREFGAGGGPGAYLPGLSDSVGIVNYFQIKLSAKDYLTIRNDYLGDYQGQRTGFKNNYTSHTIGWSHNLTDWATIRPEIRYERGYHMPAYDLGWKQDQFMFAIDLIVRF